MGLAVALMYFGVGVAWAPKDPGRRAVLSAASITIGFAAYSLFGNL